jgi:hypothetical protein
MYHHWIFGSGQKWKKAKMASAGLGSHVSGISERGMAHSGTRVGIIQRHELPIFSVLAN